MSKLQKSNISKDEREALHSLRKDSNCMVLVADKGTALVVMDKDTYIEKCMTISVTIGFTKSVGTSPKPSITR